MAIRAPDGANKDRRVGQLTIMIMDAGFNPLITQINNEDGRVVINLIILKMKKETFSKVDTKAQQRGSAWRAPNW